MPSFQTDWLIVLCLQIAARCTTRKHSVEHQSESVHVMWLIVYFIISRAGQTEIFLSAASTPKYWVPPEVLLNIFFIRVAHPKLLLFCFTCGATRNFFMCLLNSGRQKPKFFLMGSNRNFFCIFFKDPRTEISFF